MNFIAIDFETPNTTNSSICSAGISIVENNVILKNLNILLNPQAYFLQRNMDVHGILPQDVIDAPTFPDFWNDYGQYFHQYPVVAHNARYDIKVLEKCAHRYGIDLPEMTVYCTQSIWQSLHCNKRLGLNDIASELGIELKHHDSGSDSCAAAKIMIYLLENHPDFVQSISYKRLNSFSNIDDIVIDITNNLIEPEIAYHSTDIIFKDNNFVLTGEIPNYPRKNVIEIIERNGGFHKKGVSKKTNYLIVGIEDLELVKKADGKSTKIRAAEEHIANGIDIRIINHKDFIEFVEREKL